MILFFVFFFPGFKGLSNGVSQNICLSISASCVPCARAPGRCSAAAVIFYRRVLAPWLSVWQTGIPGFLHQCDRNLPEWDGRVTDLKCSARGRTGGRLIFLPSTTPVPNLCLDSISLSGSFLLYVEKADYRDQIFLIFQIRQQISHLSDVNPPDTRSIFLPLTILFHLSLYWNPLSFNISTSQAFRSLPAYQTALSFRWQLI